MQGDQVLTLNTAAERLGVNPRTLRRQAVKGKLVATKHGRDWLTTVDSVERYRVEHLGRHGWDTRRQNGEEQA
jgi:excisionase family DNA binding protein